MAGKRRDPIPPEIIEYARHGAQQQIARRDRRARASRALAAVRDAIATTADLYRDGTEIKPEAERRYRLWTELEIEERRLALYVEVPPTLPEAKPGDAERDVMIRILADPAPTIDHDYPPTRGTTPLATTRQIAAWIANGESKSAVEIDIDPTTSAARDRVKRAAKAAREQTTALDEERAERRLAMAAFDTFTSDDE